MISAKYKVLALLAVFGAYTWFVYDAGQDSSDRKHALVEAKRLTGESKAVKETVETNRVEEQRRSDIVEAVDEAQSKKSADDAVDVDASNDAAQRLRIELGKLQRVYSSSVATCDTRVAQQREAGQAAIDLLSRLYQEADFEAGELAAALEDARGRGLSCETIYDGVRNKHGR